MRPDVVIADQQSPSAEEIFRPLDLGLLSEIKDVLDHLALHDPDVLAAVEDVDRTLIWEASNEAPLARLARSIKQAQFYEHLKAST